MYKISANTFFIGKKYIYLPSCHSTNDIAASYITNNQVYGGEVFVTSHQLKGRGQRGNSWISEPDKNITLSIILKPTFLQAKDQFKLNIAISLGIIHFLEHYLKSGLKIKWPNDIFLDDFKLGGILIENYLRKQIIESSIIGIGINVNQTDFNDLNATSICKATGKTYQLEVLIENLLESIEAKFIDLRNGSFERMKQHYISNLYKYQEHHQFIDLKYNKGKKFIGEILGIEPSGKLTILNIQDNLMLSFDFKEIQFINT